MKKYALMFLLALSTLLFAAGANAQTVNTKWKGQSINDYYKYVGPDVDVQLGIGYTWNKVQDNSIGYGRLRMGVLGVPKYPWIFAAGLTAEANSNSTFIWGGQVEVLHFGSGFWLRGGLGGDYLGRPAFNSAIGYSLFGVELQGMAAGPNSRDTLAVMATVRIPIGFLLYVFTKN